MVIIYKVKKIIYLKYQKVKNLKQIFLKLGNYAKSYKKINKVKKELND